MIKIIHTSQRGSGIDNKMEILGTHGSKIKSSVEVEKKLFSCYRSLNQQHGEQT